MANSKSAAKRARQSERRHEANKGVRTRVKTYRRKVQAALDAGDKAAAAEGLKELASAADLAAKKGAVHANRAAAVKSEMSRRVAAAS
ncbi:MAG: 30S ribosomal protein S20 [Verrucomicrobiota bacterium]